MIAMTEHKDINAESGIGRITIPAPLRFSDTDANGHLFFGTYFTIFDTAFLNFLDIIGYSFDTFCQEGFNFYYVEATSQYKASVKFSDRLDVNVWIDKIGRTSFTVMFEALNHSIGKIAATGRIVAVVVDFETEEPVPVPAAFRQIIEGTEK